MRNKAQAAMRIGSYPDFASAILFFLFGMAGFLGAFKYRIGSAGAMGPGYFPMVLGIGLCLLSLLILRKALRAPGECIARPGLWEAGWIIGAIVLFSLLVEKLGLFPSALLLIAGCRIGSRDFRLREVAVFGLIVAAASTAIFVYGLGIELPAFPTFSD